jgi:hypothetical protein
VRAHETAVRGSERTGVPTPGSEAGASFAEMTGSPLPKDFACADGRFCVLVLFMIPTTPPAPAGRFPLMIEAPCGVVATRSADDGIAVPLLVAIRSRLRRFGARFAALAARFSAGIIGGAAARRRPQLPPMSRRVAWFVRKVPEAGRFREELHYLLWQPEMAARVAATPQARRSLRLLCEMLGVELPPGLFARRTPGGPGLPPGSSGLRSAPPAEPATGGRASPRSRHAERARLLLAGAVVFLFRS